ncbi:DUF927 domain-containing protein [Burkholderia vietnamiensis]|uniref:DUF927 domain-containing protein n=1 Tax=Burkholderia vietnamiensis TaxID=60552 RepID=UPI001CF3CB70|nr:DUF927 domain-containing protein [Burkholderia vietnamiensis]MCA8180222.1 DUF927 domain-containing protein [Burkholderia vietnamiensis]
MAEGPQAFAHLEETLSMNARISFSSDQVTLDGRSSDTQRSERVTLKDLQALTTAIPSVPFKQIAELALEHFDEVIDILGLEGDYRGKEFEAYNPKRDDASLGSFKINSETGFFADFACDDECKGGDLIALAAYVWDCGMTAAAKRLLDELQKRHIEMPSKTDTVPVLRKPTVHRAASTMVMSPIPEGSPELDARQFVRHGSILEDRYDYVDANGRLCFIQLRLRQADGKKTFCTLQVKCREDGSLHWTGGMPPGLRPLFGLRELIEGDQLLPVFVVEGEKSALALRSVGTKAVVVTSAGGANAGADTDWSPLAGRSVVIWPDNDEAGVKYQNQVIKLIRAVAPSTQIKVVDAGRVMCSLCEAQGWSYDEKADAMTGWDVANVVQLGLPTNVIADWLKNALIDVPVPLGNDGQVRQIRADEHRDPVTWASGKTYTIDDEGVIVWKWQKDEQVPVMVSSRVDILRQLRDQESSGWSLELRLHKPDGVQQMIVVRRATLSDSRVFRETFSDLGVIVYNWVEFNDYLAHAETRETHELVRSVGWSGTNYMRADRAFGQGAEAVALDPDAPACAAFGRQGTLDAWNEQIGQRCVDNSRLMLAVCAALAGPLLHLVGVENGGLHLVGPSSVGKTTALRVAASVWGRPTGFIRSWRSTSNGLESVAAGLNDGVLLIDEMNQATPQEAGDAVYMLGNGQGKTRMTRHGIGARLLQWRLVFMSTGEIPLQQHLESAGKSVRAGMEVRLLNVPADARCGYGMFDTLHGFNDGRALSDHLLASASGNYGVAGDAWLTHLTEQMARHGHGEFCEMMRARLIELEGQFTRQNSDGQVIRAARRFALLALAGEAAVDAGVGGWCAGDATAMMQQCFDAWIEERGGVGSGEEAQALRQMQLFFEQHGQASFQRIESGLHGESADNFRTISQRAGYFSSSTDHGGVFHVLPEPFRNSVCSGLNWKFVLEVLRKHGLLLRDAGQPARVPGLRGLSPIRSHWISERIVGFDPAGQASSASEN